MARKWKTLDEILPSEMTPMLRQYVEAKTQCPDSILFFRMGDFFEMFFEDAVAAAEILGLALTTRDGADSDHPVPMCGVPFRAVDSYIARVIKAGRTVTLCDQIEDPKEAKGIVKRAIIRTITPGTVIESSLLEDTVNNYLGALFVSEGENPKAGLALVDVSTGEFLVAQITGDTDRTLSDELSRMAPVEVLVPRLDEEPAIYDALRTRFDGVRFTPRPLVEFDDKLALELLESLFGLSTLKGVALDGAPEAAACVAAALSYLRDTQRDMAPRLRLPRRYSPSGYVVLDGNTQRNLELVESQVDKKRRGTLLDTLDYTCTHMGGRKLRHWILHPLLDMDAINARLDAVEDFVNDAEWRMVLTDVFKGIGDLERILGRITAKAGNARDMKALGRSLEQVPELRAALDRAQAPLLISLRDGLDELRDVAGWIDKAVLDEPPLAITEGDILKDGYDPQLDHFRELVRGGRDWIAALQRDESARSGIPNLKVGYNKVFGYYIEISRANTHLVPPDYERKQTLVNAERYITPTLKSREEEILTAQERMQKLEYDLFTELRERVSRESRRIQETADTIASLDVLLSLAVAAVSRRYCRPVMDDGDLIQIREGRHPVVEALMSSRGGSSGFVPNDTLLDPEGRRVQIVTGPNMAGKSTYLRQVALIVLMAQTGSFVPAAEAQIGVVDRIFTRVGASDNLVRGESTFMVEMIETANILNTATNRSLLVLDEIGRGTSTFDGISIAWAVAEHIHDSIGAKTLFATHYHELTELASKLEHIQNVNVAVREWNGKVVFLYRIVDGGADHSYGIQVAKLAGLPPKVLTRARNILELLESGNTAALGLPQQMTLFGPQHFHQPGPLERELAAIDPDQLTPRQAHELVYHLKRLTDSETE